MLDTENNTPWHWIKILSNYMNQQILGQQRLVSRMLVALLADGHLLVEGAPGLAKTRAVKTLANGLEGDFKRIQFTPDLLPSDLTGTDVYRPEDGSFHFQHGPLFHQVIVADEINRAPAKVQSALLESMEERQITVGKNTFPLSELFFVMATQNPIEQEGTYPLPEAQLDRFLMKVDIDYPSVVDEIAVMKQVHQEALRETDTITLPSDLPLTQEVIFEARKQVLQTFLAESIEEYIAQLVQATRNAGEYSPELAQWIQYGASPRASLAFNRCSRALAWLDSRDYVSPEDIQQLAHEILRHRVLLTYRGEMDGVDTDRVVDELLLLVPVP
jgi:MoxR-like ATPase